MTSSSDKADGKGRTNASENLRVLWLTRLLPFPPAQGGDVIYSRQLVENLAAAGVSVTALCASGDGSPVETGANWVRVNSPERPLWRSLLSSLPNTAARYYTENYRRALREHLQSQAWDAVIFDHLSMLSYVDDVRRLISGKPVRPVLIYLSHNHEESVRWELAKMLPGGLIHRAALFADAIKCTVFERRASGVCDLITSNTVADELQFAKHGRKGRGLVVEPGYAGRRVVRRRLAEVGRVAIILGSFQWIAKRQNLQEFLQAASNLFPAAAIELLVVGYMDDEYRQWLKAEYPWATIVGPVDDPAQELARARVGIVPEQMGGGFKHKILDYVFSGTVVGSLNVAMAGMPLEPGEHYIGGSDVVALCNAIIAGMDDVGRLETISQKAFARCEAAFDWHDRAQRIRCAIVAEKAKQPAQAGD